MLLNSKVATRVNPNTPHNVAELRGNKNSLSVMELNNGKNKLTNTNVSSKAITEMTNESKMN